MEVDYLILARHAERALDGSFNVLGAAVDVQPTPEFPVVYPAFYVLAKITLQQTDLDRPHVIMVRFKDQNDEVMISAGDMLIPVQELPPDRTHSFANVILALQNAIFPTEGVYRCELLIDGKVEKTARLRFELQMPIKP